LDRIDDWLAALEARSAHSPLAYGIQHEAAIRALCEGYLRASARDRCRIRYAMGDKDGIANQLLAVVFRAAEQLRATGDAAWLRIGIAADALQTGRMDPRDRKMAVDALWAAAEDAGLDADAVVRVVYESH
jgi:hypothetical protein